MKKSLLFLLVFIILIIPMSYSQTNIALDDFETVPSSPSFGFVFSGGGYQTGTTAAGDRPASVNYFATGARSYQVNNNTATLTSPAINTTGNNYVTFKLRVMAVTINNTGQGLDLGDFVRIEISPDNGTNWWNTLEITGFNNAWWGFGTGTATASTAYDGNATTVTFSPAAGGGRTTDGYSYIYITNIPIVTQMRIRITMTNSQTAEQWVIDDAQLIGSVFPLPVKFTGITAFEKQTGVQIDWNVATEENTSRYQVERSADGITFTAIGTIDARSQSKYGYFDIAPLPGISYYRLRSIDADGKAFYSSIVRVTLNKNDKEIRLYPNPVTDGNLSFQSSDFSRGTYSVRIFNAGGQQVYTNKFSHTGGALNQTIQLPGSMKSGMYNIQLENDGERVMNKTFVVK